MTIEDGSAEEGGFDQAVQEMHKATCADCGQKLKYHQPSVIDGLLQRMLPNINMRHNYK
jgi:hypothetical protein